MKKRILTVLALVCVLVCSVMFVACGNKSNSPEADGYKPEGTPMTAENFFDKVLGSEPSFTFGTSQSMSQSGEYEGKKISISATATMSGTVQGDKQLVKVKITTKGVPSDMQRPGMTNGTEEYEAYFDGASVYKKEKGKSWTKIEGEGSSGLGKFSFPGDRNIDAYTYENNKLTDKENDKCVIELTGKDTAKLNFLMNEEYSGLSSSMTVTATFAKIGTATVTKPTGLPQ